MSIASDIMKESDEGMGSPKTKADFAEKRASEVAVKQELSDEESTYYFKDGSLLSVHAEGTMLSGFYKVALPEFKVGQVWKTQTGTVRISVVYPSGHVLCSDNVKRNQHGRVSIYPDRANDHTGDLIELVASAPLASPPPPLKNFPCVVNPVEPGRQGYLDDQAAAMDRVSEVPDATDEKIEISNPKGDFLFATSEAPPPLLLPDFNAKIKQSVTVETEKVEDFQDGQWWLQELDLLVANGTDDQKRAVAVVRHFLKVARINLSRTHAEQSDAEGVYFANDGKERDWTHAEQIEEFRTLHAALLERGDAPVPFPSIVVHSHGTRLSIYGLNGEDIGHHPIVHLEGMKAATGYPVYVRHECKFSALTFDTYEAQS